MKMNEGERWGNVNKQRQLNHSTLGTKSHEKTSTLNYEIEEAGEDGFS